MERTLVHILLSMYVFMSSPMICCHLQPDAEFFRIDLPNSGSIVLDKPVDYETRTQLEVVLWAQVKVWIHKYYKK